MRREEERREREERMQSGASDRVACQHETVTQPSKRLSTARWSFRWASY
jgi:hypothetical protein